MRFVLSCVALLAFGIAPAFAQDDKEEATKKATRIVLDKAEDEYRTYFKRPESTMEFWAAIKFEIDVGKFDLAALHLGRLLKNEKEAPAKVDENLFKIEDAEGMVSLLRLIRVQRWSDHAPFQKEAEENVKVFFERLNAIVEKKLSDPDRINKFIRQLDAETAEERTYAYVQLNRSRERAVPYLIEKLQESMGKPLHHRIVEAMVNFDSETVPAYLEVLKARDEKDARDQELRLTLLRILRKRADARVVPYLWYLSSSPKYPLLVREQALQTLADFLKVDKDVLPPAKLALTQQSESYFKHQVKFPDRIRLWRWDGQKISTDPVELTVADAEEFFGLRYALAALELDPTFLPAQLAFLSMSLERTVLAEFDQSILKPLPTATQRLLATLDPELILKILENAYESNNIPIILGTVQALGNRGELRAAKPSSFGMPQGVVRGLYYPDRRVQYAAVNALLKMPTNQVPVATARTVDVLQRLITLDQPPIALIIGASVEKANETSAAMKEAGFRPLLAKSIQEGLEKARSLGNVEVIVLHYGMSTKELPYALTQIRGDIDHGLTPVIVVAPQDLADPYRRIAAKHRHIQVVSESTLPSADETKKLIDEAVVRVGIAKLSPEERKRISEHSLDILRQMARNQLPGYDVRSAIGNVASTVASPDLAPAALETLGRLPGSTPQMRLADVVLDPAKDKLRVPAARELNRHVQHNGLLMTKGQLDQIRNLYRNPDTDVALRTELAYFIGAFRTTPTRDGSMIFQFRPDPVAAPAAPEEKKDN